MIAGLKGYIERRAANVRTTFDRVAQRFRLRVRRAAHAMKPFAERGCSARDDGPDRRIRRCTRTPALGELACAREIDAIEAGEGSRHALTA